MLSASIKIALSGVAFTTQFIALSFVINEVWLGEAHEMYDFLRPDDDYRVNPGLGIVTLFWSILISMSYRFFGNRIRVHNSILRGATYGLFVFLFFIGIHEFYLYQFIKFDFIIIFGSLLHYLLAFIFGGGLIGWINGNFEKG